MALARRLLFPMIVWGAPDLGPRIIQRTCSATRFRSSRRSDRPVRPEAKAEQLTPRQPSDECDFTAYEYPSQGEHCAAAAGRRRATVEGVQAVRIASRRSGGKARYDGVTSSRRSQVSARTDKVSQFERSNGSSCVMSIVNLLNDDGNQHHQTHLRDAKAAVDAGTHFIPGWSAAALGATHRRSSVMPMAVGVRCQTALSFTRSRTDQVMSVPARRRPGQRWPVLRPASYRVRDWRSSGSASAPRYGDPSSSACRATSMRG